MTLDQLEQLLEVYDLNYILEMNDISESEVLLLLLELQYIVLPETIPLS
jgi:hypothetical protein